MYTNHVFVTLLREGGLWGGFHTASTSPSLGAIVPNRRDLLRPGPVACLRCMFYTRILGGGGAATGWRNRHGGAGNNSAIYPPPPGDDAPAQRKKPSNPPSKPPISKVSSEGGLKHVIRFLGTPLHPTPVVEPVLSLYSFFFCDLLLPRLAMSPCKSPGKIEADMKGTVAVSSTHFPDLWLFFLAFHPFVCYFVDSMLTGVSCHHLPAIIQRLPTAFNHQRSDIAEEKG